MMTRSSVKGQEISHGMKINNFYGCHIELGGYRTATVEQKYNSASIR